MLLPNLLISEVYPHPNISESEWIEIYNPTTQPIDLTGYSLYEHISQTNLLVEFNNDTESVVIEPQSFYVYTLSSNKLNNTKELITLLNTDATIVDSFEYTNSKLAHSFNRDFTTQNQALNDTYLAQPTPNAVNQLQILSIEPKEIEQNNLISQISASTEDTQQKETIEHTQDTKETQIAVPLNEQTLQSTPKINIPLLQYQQLSSELNSFPSTKKVKSENIQPRDSKFSYLVQKHVSLQGFVNAIIGGSLLLLTGFLL